MSNIASARIQQYKIRDSKRVVNTCTSIDISTARPIWRHDGPALSGYLLYSVVNPVYANSYHHHLIRLMVCNILMGKYGFHIIISIKSSYA